MRDKIAATILTFSILCFGCQNTFSHNDELISNQVNNQSLYNFSDILNLITQAPCDSIKIYSGVPFYNLTGKITSQIKEGTVLHMTSVRDLTFNHSLYAAAHCFPIWRVKLNNTQKFFIKDVPPGQYVISLPAYQFVNTQGIPILDEFNDKNYELVIALFGGDSRYSLIVFEIRSQNNSNRPDKLV